MQWVFDKRRVFGEAASHLSLVASGADALVAARQRRRWWRWPRARSPRPFPARASATLVRGTVVREKQATFSLAPGQPARPGVETSGRRSVLAGDWIDTGLPGTIESAAVAGHRAAGGDPGRSERAQRLSHRSGPGPGDPRSR